VADNPDDLAFFVHHVVDETGVLVAETVVILPQTWLVSR